MRLAVLALSLLLVPAWCRAEPPKSKDAFLAAVQEAFEARDINKVHELTWEKGMTDFDKRQQAQMLPMILNNPQSTGIGSVTFQPLPADFLSNPVAFGRRLGVTHAPDGVINLELKMKDPGSTSAMTLPYARIDGAYYLVTSKTTDLGWKGPPDKSLMLNVLGQGQDKVKIHVKYNASGVDLEKDESSASVGFTGQYISEVTVTSTSDDVNVTLSLGDGATGKNYYKSQPLVGKGVIAYHKGDAGVE